MITHQEAEVLTSARQDAPLDPMVERELQAHLATCAQCRAFAASTERLTAGIKALPSIPASPRVKREVMERVHAGRGPFATLLGGFGTGFQTGPALAALALVVMVGIFGWFAFDRLFIDNDGDGPSQVAAVATEVSRPQEIASPTALSSTETPVPTSTVAPTATTAPQPTASTEPTATETEETAPTETPEPTATTEASEESVVNEAPVDLTTDATQVPEETPLVTKEPAAQAAQPTATLAPVETPTPTNTPPIELIDDATKTPTPPIEPTNNNQDGTETANDGESGAQQADKGESTPADAPETGATAESTDVASESPISQPLADVSERYTGIAGDPVGHLGLTNDGRLEFMSVPDGASMTTPGGFSMQVAESQPGVVDLCSDGVCEPSMIAPEDGGWQGDVPMGMEGNTVYFLRLYEDRSELYAADPQGAELLEANLIAEFGPSGPPTAVYESEGALFAWLPSGEWLVISGGSGELLSGSYANPTNVRFAPLAESGPLIGYFSDNTLIIAPVSVPDSPIFITPADGVDFDIAPPGDQVAVIRGNDIVIFDLQGNELAIYEGGDSQPGSLIWLRSGLIWVDRTNEDALYQIPETAP